MGPGISRADKATSDGREGRSEVACGCADCGRAVLRYANGQNIFHRLVGFGRPGRALIDAPLIRQSEARDSSPAAPIGPASKKSNWRGRFSTKARRLLVGMIVSGAGVLMRFLPKGFVGPNIKRSMGSIKPPAAPNNARPARPLRRGRAGDPSRREAPGRDLPS